MPTARRKCQSCGLNRQPKFYVSERGRICLTCQKKRRKTTSRAGHVKRTYGLSDADYKTLWEWNDGRCWICGEARSYELNVDHDHALGDGREAVRGLLCRRCNKLLASVRDNSLLLELAARYLDFNRAQYVLRRAA